MDQILPCLKYLVDSCENEDFFIAADAIIDPKDKEPEFLPVPDRDLAEVMEKKSAFFLINNIDEEHWNLLEIQNHPQDWKMVMTNTQIYKTFTDTRIEKVLRWVSRKYDPPDPP